MTYNRVREVYDQRWNKVIEEVIQIDSSPLYIFDPVYFSSTVSANLTVPEGPAAGIAFAGMADQDGQEEHK